ncbi:hypothetical protein BV898_15954 [Hypsibius exemplaris]|uniref:Uncharacterized protein n=1 Tax=Hypsibius exemplaris TaxID=2072580 RepID=A0A9X6NEY8_HYPEX|nr:hypothetical protein BV898_15954 [Hypsibius exemplaris]
MWDRPIIELAIESLITTAEVTGRASLLAVMSEFAGVCLNFLLVSSLGNLLDDNCLRILVVLRLGATGCQPHNCHVYGKEVRENGHRGLSCAYGISRGSRHSAINEVVKRALVSAGVPAVPVTPGLCRVDGKQPNEMTMTPFQHGKALLRDATISNTLTMSNIIRTTAEAGRKGG